MAFRRELPDLSVGSTTTGGKFRSELPTLAKKPEEIGASLVSKANSPYKLSGPTFLNQTPPKKIPLGFIGRMANAAYTSVKDTIDAAAYSLGNALSKLGNDTKPLERGVAMGQAGLGLAGLGFLPVTAQIAAAKELPGILGKPAQGADWVFRKLGEVGSYALVKGVDQLRISPESKETLKPLAEELGAFTAQLIGIKAAHGVASRGLNLRGLGISEKAKANISGTASLGMGLTVTPFSTAFGIANKMVARKTLERQQKGIEITPEETKKIVEEVKEELPKEIDGIVIEEPTLPKLKHAKDIELIQQFDEQIGMNAQAMSDLKTDFGKLEKFAIKGMTGLELPELQSGLSNRQLSMSELELKKTNERAWFRRFGDMQDYDHLSKTYGIEDYEGLRVKFEEYQQAKRRLAELKKTRAAINKGQEVLSDADIEQVNKVLQVIPTEVPVEAPIERKPVLKPLPEPPVEPKTAPQETIAPKMDKAQAMRQAMAKRAEEGKPTTIEYRTAQDYLDANYKGKSVKVDGKSGTVIGTAFGRIKIRFEDGTVKAVDAEKIEAPLATDEQIIERFKETTPKLDTPNEPLLSEARKYKTAEEFVNSKNFYKDMKGISRSEVPYSETLGKDASQISTFDMGDGVKIEMSQEWRLGDGRSAVGTRDKFWNIERIYSTDKGKGNATRALDKVLKLADESGVTLQLEPLPIGSKTMSASQLSDWYARKGFVFDGKNMVRQPKSNLTSLWEQANRGIEDVRPDSMFGVNPTGNDAPVPKINPFDGTPIVERTQKVVEKKVEQPTAPIEPKPEGNKTSGLAKSIEAKTVEAGLVHGFRDMAQYDSSTIKEQAKIFTDFINTEGVESARAVVRGEKPLPQGQKGGSFILGMEEYLKKHPDADMAFELANSPLVTGVSEAASELGLMQNREQDSATAKIMEVKKARKARAEARVSTAVEKVVKSNRVETEKVNLPKEELIWDKFLDSIKC